MVWGKIGRYVRNSKPDCRPVQQRSVAEPRPDDSNLDAIVGFGMTALRGRVSETDERDRDRCHCRVLETPPIEWTAEHFTLMVCDPDCSRWHLQLTCEANESSVPDPRELVQCDHRIRALTENRIIGTRRARTPSPEQIQRVSPTLRRTHTPLSTTGAAARTEEPAQIPILCPEHDHRRHPRATPRHPPGLAESYPDYSQKDRRCMLSRHNRAWTLRPPHTGACLSPKAWDTVSISARTISPGPADGLFSSRRGPMA